MKYTSNDKPCPRGEIWIRGANVTSGYYKMPEKTCVFSRRVFFYSRARQEEFIDGWFKTGDIGQLNTNGTLSIIDRIKNLVKPPHGEYIAYVSVNSLCLLISSIEKLESMYKNCPLVANLMVFAHSGSDFVVALVQPNKSVLEKQAAGKIGEVAMRFGFVSRASTLGSLCASLLRAKSS